MDRTGKRSSPAGNLRAFSFPKVIRSIGLCIGMAVPWAGWSAGAAAPGADAAVEEAAYRLGPLARTRVEIEERMGHDPGQGVGARLEAARERLEAGNAAMQTEDFAGAKACYEASLAAAGWVQTNAPLREMAREKRAAASEFRRKAVEHDGPHLGLTAWREGEAERETAMAAYERGEFAASAVAWAAAAAAYRRADDAAKAALVERGLEAARGARRLGAWNEVIAAADDALAQDPENAEALELKKNAVISLVAEGGGRSKTTGADTRASGRRIPAAAVSAAGTVKTITLPGGEKMEMVWCPPGSFMMGSPMDEAWRNPDETPHRVTLTKGFWMAKTEVTQKQWRSVMGSNPSYSEGDDLPVENVSWEDCQMFCWEAGLSLPTEAEWEYACRAGSTGAFAGNLDRMAGWREDSDGPTHPVGVKRANAWGLHDMHGNVWEWCADWYGTYPNGAVTNPAGVASGLYRVLRGDPLHGRAAYRFSETPDFRSLDFGFRPVARPG